MYGKEIKKKEGKGKEGYEREGKKDGRRKEEELAVRARNKRMRLPLSPGRHLWQFKRLHNQVWIYGESKPTLRCSGRQPLPTVHGAIHVLVSTCWWVPWLCKML